MNVDYAIVSREIRSRGRRASLPFVTLLFLPKRTSAFGRACSSMSAIEFSSIHVILTCRNRYHLRDISILRGVQIHAEKARFFRRRRIARARARTHPTHTHTHPHFFGGELVRFLEMNDRKRNPQLERGARRWTGAINERWKKRNESEG